jgi:hypothetical protein
MDYDSAYQEARGLYKEIFGEEFLEQNEENVDDDSEE